MLHGNAILYDEATDLEVRVGSPFYKFDAIRCALPHHQAVLLNREWVRDAGGFDERYGLSADIHLMGRALRNFGSYYVPVDIVRFRQGGASTGLERSRQAIRDRARAINDSFGLLIGNLHLVFLCYFIPKIAILTLLKGTWFDRSIRRRRMRRQKLLR
jgi:hypothetical protein